MGKSRNKKVDISAKVTQSVTGLGKPVRGETKTDMVFTAKWKYPKKAFSESEKSRFQGVIVEWVVDTVKAPSKATKGSKKKPAEITGINKTTVIYHQVLEGSKKTEATLKLPRNEYYPVTQKSEVYVQLWVVTKAKHTTKGWKITGSKRYSLQEKEDVRKEQKQGVVFTQAQLKKFAKSNSIVGKVYYKSLNAVKKVPIAQPKLYGVGVRVQGWNKKSPCKPSNKGGTTKASVIWDPSAPTKASYFAFENPKAPIYAGIEIAPADYVNPYLVSASYIDDQDDKTTPHERYDSTISCRVVGATYDSLGAEATLKPFSKNLGTYTFSGTAFSKSFKPNEQLTNERTVASLRPNEYISYYFKAISKGARGNSAWTKEKSCIIARPHDVTVNNVVEVDGYYRVSFTISGVNRSTDTFTLQRLYNYRPSAPGDDSLVDDWDDAQWKAAAEREPDSSWQDAAVLGFNGGGVFTDLVINARPDPFRRTYYRVIASNSIDQFWSSKSSVFVVPGYFKIPSAKSQESKILACSSAENGSSIMSVVAFKKTKDENGYVLSNGTEMSWDTFEHAWESSSPATSYDFKDDVVGPILVTQALKDEPPTDKYLKDVPLKWAYATYYLRGVQPREKYYVKARRFLKNTETRESDSYGAYAMYETEDGALATIEVKAIPKEVKITVPEKLVAGKDLSVSWTYDSDDTQVAYQVLWLQGMTDAAKDKAQELLMKEDSAPYAVIPWADVEKYLMGPEGAKDQLYVAVRMCVEKGSWSDISDVKAVKIVRAPRAALGQLETLRSQPLKCTFGTDNPKSAIVARIVAQQLLCWGPEGKDDVAEGTIVYSTKITVPNWALDEATGWYYCNYEFSDDIDFRDGGIYTLEYTARLDEEDLVSDTIDEDGEIVKQTSTFTVNYSLPEDQVTEPEFYIVCDKMTEEHNGHVRISIPDMVGVNEGCVADLYRVTPDGVYRLAKDLTDWRNATITDKFPPYSRHEPCTYRLAMRSKNGVTEWTDRSYAFPGYCIRFDWGDPDIEAHGGYNHLVLPYNLKWSDSWTKNSRIDLHLDGTYNGYWRGGVDHKNTMSTELVKLTGAEQIERVYSLARYAGPVLVRLPNGCAFAADVQVSNLDVSYDSLVVTASFSAQEIRMPEEFLNNSVVVEQGLYLPVS